MSVDRAPEPGRDPGHRQGRGPGQEPHAGTPHAGLGARLGAVVRQRCPVCLRGPVFRSLLGMHRTCPVCGLLYEREHGYFLNSMFIAYAVGFLVLVPSALLLAMRNVSVGLFSAVIIVETIVIWPLIFRFSRVVWMHADQMLDPRRPPAAGPPEPEEAIPVRESIHDD